MRSDEPESEKIDVEQIMRQIHERIRERHAARQGGQSDATIARLTEQRIEHALDGTDFDIDLLAELRKRSSRWNYKIDGDALYASTRDDALGRLLAAIRTRLNPLLRLFVNTNPILLALRRQAQLNTYCVSLLHEQALELTRLRLLVESFQEKLGERAAPPERTPGAGDRSA